MSRRRGRMPGCDFLFVLAVLGAGLFLLAEELIEPIDEDDDF